MGDPTYVFVRGVCKVYTEHPTVESSHERISVIRSPTCISVVQYAIYVAPFKQVLVMIFHETPAKALDDLLQAAWNGCWDPRIHLKP